MGSLQQSSNRISWKTQGLRFNLSLRVTFDSWAGNPIANTTMEKAEGGMNVVMSFMSLMHTQFEIVTNAHDNMQFIHT